MAVLNDIHATPREPMRLRVEDMVRRARRRFADWRLYRRTVAELNELGDRELRDLGLSRAMVRRIAWESVYGG